MGVTMENLEPTDYQRYEKARKKAVAIRGFYIHLTAYCVLIPVIVFINLKFTPEYYWFFFTIFGWGTGLSFHAMEAFGKQPFLGKKWQERKIAELLEIEKNKQSKSTNKQ